MLTRSDLEKLEYVSPNGFINYFSVIDLTKLEYYNIQYALANFAYASSSGSGVRIHDVSIIDTARVHNVLKANTSKVHGTNIS